MEFQEDWMSDDAPDDNETELPSPEDSEAAASVYVTLHRYAPVLCIKRHNLTESRVRRLVLASIGKFIIKIWGYSHLTPSRRSIHARPLPPTESQCPHCQTISRQTIRNGKHLSR